MRFELYINESFENKIFELIDTFMNDKGIKDVDSLLSNENLQNLIDAINKTFQVGQIIVRGTPGNSIDGQSTGNTITVGIPMEYPLDNKLKISMLGTLFHELSHHFQIQDGGAKLAKGYIDSVDTTYGFVTYFLQKIERYPKAISTSVTCLLEGVDLISDVKEIKKIASQVKDLDELNTELHKFSERYNDKVVYSMSNIGDFLIVAFFVYGTHLFTDFPKKNKQELRNKFEVFMRNYTKAYTGFYHYFKKYKII